MRITARGVVDAVAIHRAGSFERGVIPLLKNSFSRLGGEKRGEGTRRPIEPEEKGGNIATRPFGRRSNGIFSGGGEGSKPRRFLSTRKEEAPGNIGTGCKSHQECFVLGFVENLGNRKRGRRWWLRGFLNRRRRNRTSESRTEAASDASRGDLTSTLGGGREKQEAFDQVGGGAREKKRTSQIRVTMSMASRG